MKANPHPSTEAWEQFQKENEGLLDSSILSSPSFNSLLLDRLHRAFTAGAEAERKRIVEKDGV